MDKRTSLRGNRRALIDAMGCIVGFDEVIGMWKG
jgi:hypothetical protein